jgi:hypothetical protein
MKMFYFVVRGRAVMNTGKSRVNEISKCTDITSGIICVTYL